MLTSTILPFEEKGFEIDARATIACAKEKRLSEIPAVSLRMDNYIERSDTKINTLQREPFERAVFKIVMGGGCEQEGDKITCDCRRHVNAESSKHTFNLKLIVEFIISLVLT